MKCNETKDNTHFSSLQYMYEAVRNGDYTSLNNALDKKNADINMTWVMYDLICTAYNVPLVGIEI